MNFLNLWSKTGKKILEDQNLWKSNEYRLFDPHPVYRWKEKLSASEKLALRILTGKYLNHFGYL